MNKIKFIASLVFLFCLVGLNIYGQKKEITKEEFSEAYKKAGEKRGKLSHRIVSELFVYGDDEIKIKQNEKGFSEFVAPNRRRMFTEFQDNQLNKTFIFETIRIDDIEYKKDKNGVWTKKIFPKIQVPPHNKTTQSNAKHFLTGNIRLDNQPADLFELEVEYNHQLTNPKTGEVSEHTTYRNEKRWISKDGLLLKIEMVDHKLNPAKTFSRRILSYEYDPNIKIEAPIK